MSEQTRAQARERTTEHGVPPGLSVDQTRAHGRPEMPMARDGAPRTSRLLKAAVGSLLLGLGGAAAVAGLRGNQVNDRVDVLGVTMNSGIGLVLVALGLLLVVAAFLHDGRPVAAGVGGLLVTGGVLLVSATDELLAQIASGRGVGWIAVVAGALAALSAFLHPSDLDGR